MSLPLQQGFAVVVNTLFLLSSKSNIFLELTNVFPGQEKHQKITCGRYYKHFTIESTVARNINMIGVMLQIVVPLLTYNRSIFKYFDKCVLRLRPS